MGQRRHHKVAAVCVCFKAAARVLAHLGWWFQQLLLCMYSVAVYPAVAYND
jgi:hypothetical protein